MDACPAPKNQAERRLAPKFQTLFTRPWSGYRIWPQGSPCTEHLYAAIAFAPAERPTPLIALLAWTPFWLVLLKDPLKSLFSGPVMIRWDGTTLEISHHVTALARIEGALWIYGIMPFWPLRPTNR